MKHFIYTAVLIFVLIILTGCGHDGHAEHHHEDTKVDLVLLDIAFETDPSEIEHGSDVILSSTILNKKDPVENAEVKFEIWTEGQEVHDMIEASHSGSGKYAIEHTFNDAGNYHVIVHVTTPEVHQMIEKEFEVH